MITAVTALSAIPPSLRTPLLDEYNGIVLNYLERRWTPSELSGGKFCEIVYTILDGHAKGTYATTPSKPPNFVMACRQFETNVHVPRSFQILIPRLLPALYEIRNNRGVGHVGGDVDSNHMDATAVLSTANWIMSELVRVYHNLTTEEAQQLVDSLVVRRIPLVWQSGQTKRVLNTQLSFQDQLLLLISSSPSGVSSEDLLTWTEQKNKSYLKRILQKLHDSRLIEVTLDGKLIHMLPPGSKYVEENLIKAA